LGNRIELPSEEVVPPGPYRRLLVELHQLYQAAGRPALRTLSAEIRADYALPVRAVIQPESSSRSRTPYTVGPERPVPFMIAQPWSSLASRIASTSSSNTSRWIPEEAPNAITGLISDHIGLPVGGHRGEEDGQPGQCRPAADEYGGGERLAGRPGEGTRDHGEVKGAGQGKQQDKDLGGCHALDHARAPRAHV